MLGFRPWRFLLAPFSSALNRASSKHSDSGVRSLVNVVKDEKKMTANVIMQRPPVNSLNCELLKELTEAIKDLEKNQFRGMILSSNSPTVFSAGLDILEMYQPKEEKLKVFWTTLQNMWKTLYATPLITIAAVNGHAPAGGCLLSMSCDHVVMVKSRSSIGLNETALGIVAPKWFCSTYVSAIGYRKAEHALKLGTMFTPEEALKLGLVHELVDSPADVMHKAEEEMEKWLKVPAPAFQKTKMDLRKPMVDELVSYEKQEVIDVTKLISSDVVQKSLGHYMEKLKGKKTP